MSSISSVASNPSLSGSSAAASPSAGSGSSPITITGLASGLDTNSIVTGLLAIDQQRITDLQNQQTTVTTQETAFKDIEAKLLSLQGDVGQLNQTQNGVFNVQNATSSNQNLLTAAASSSAVPGVYSLRINNLAQASEVASQGFDSAGSTISQGTFTVRAGSGAAATITVDSTNDSLQGLADAINSAAVGVTATVVNDGSGSGTQPYRLLLASSQTGTSNAIKITNNLAASGGGAVQPIFNAPTVGPADSAAGNTSTAAATSATAAGGYTGSANNTYTFTVVNGGTVGTDNNIQLSYTDSSGANTGTLTLNSGDAGVLKDVAQGIQVQFGQGTLVAGDTFSVDAFVPTVQTAADASVTVGSGSGALTVTSPSNQVDGLIQGVTLNLTGADSSQPVSVTVASDTSKASQAIQNFVTDYNGLMSYIDQQVSYDSGTGNAGPLLGDQRALDIQNQVRNAVTAAVPGASPQLNSLAALGITTNDQGQLTIDQNKLSSVLSGGVAGVTLQDVSNLFTLSGQSSNSGVQFVSGSDNTHASATPYQVNVTQPATQASITGTNSTAASTQIDGSNNTLTVSVDGTTSSTITLTAGTYTRQALAQELQAEINGNSNLQGRQVTVGVSGNQLTITSSSYGSSSAVAIGSGTALAALGFTGTESTKGQDVVGNFLVNGTVEPATGFGQFLQGNSGNANTADLQVRLTLTQGQIGSGPQASLTVTRGIASALNSALNTMLDPVSGRLQTIDQNYQTTLQNLQNEQTQDQQAMDTKRQSLLDQFTAMEQTVSQLQTISNYLATTLSPQAISGSSSSSSAPSSSTSTSKGTVG